LDRTFDSNGVKHTVLLKQIGMGAGTLEDDLVTRQFIHEQPIRFDMALTPSFVVAGQGMVPMAVNK
jgi:hypothetical protein